MGLITLVGSQAGDEFVQEQRRKAASLPGVQIGEAKAMAWRGDRETVNPSWKPKTSPTDPERNMSPLKIGNPKRKLIFQPSIFQGRAVKFRGVDPRPSTTCEFHIWGFFGYKVCMFQGVCWNFRRLMQNCWRGGVHVTIRNPWSWYILTCWFFLW